MSESELQEPESPPLYQLVYASAATHDFSQEELTELLAIARRNNTAQGVSGLLVYSDMCFLQALEGPREAVEAVFHRIEQDPRHENTKLLYRGEVEEPAFEDWAMGFVLDNAAAAPDGFHSFLKSGFRRNLEIEGDVARKALIAFRDGRFRQNVDT